MISNRDAARGLVDRVTDEVKKEIAHSFQETLVQAKELLGETELKALDEAERIVTSTGRRAESSRRRIIGGAELAARNKSLQLVEESVGRVFEASLSEAGRQRGTQAYQEALRRFIEEGVRAIGDPQLTILCNRDDMDLVKSSAGDVARNLQVDLQVASQPIECKGGVRVRNQSATAVFDNTFEARLERMRPILRRRVFDILTKEELKEGR